ncbi:UDP-glucose dehydrogenase family protein [Phaeovulum vinaykumarii]|uniref:UDP-glucose 6-dehydrogenase n=1 Tax=Phaeovulum vinaykumarii TaxID=407234 RepID=A0A1N7MB56_9RHOB|nr:nucleotide sugar dehydrogenase [Phaeovulum vinaykumarii]SIS83300.1 GDP-mannose 6-dehydrogenase [Phaeovulum vinaykumarii]SOC10306.1 GDP-mannose 6-dehydrogenase [Phaeovulum vinaykumarii]
MLHQASPQAFRPFEVIDTRPAISVVGLGYVGAVSTACLSALGHRVVGVDLDPVKVDAIRAGRAPLHEHDLDRLLSEGCEAGLIEATDDLVRAVQDTDVTFVSVGTPTAEDGSCDLRYIRAAAQAIGQGLRVKNAYHVVVMRCSIPPGSTMGVMVPEIERASGRVAGVDFGVCFNPEFLREGVAVADFNAPPKTVIGASDDRAAAIVSRIYEPVDPAPVLTSIETAEMVKYVDNVWHAAKVTFANEIGRLCKPLEVDSHAVMDIFVRDTKLNLSPYYLKPGFAYGGSCLPKEVRAVTHLAGALGVDLPMIRNLERSNRAQIAEALEMVRRTGARRVAVLGLAFKPGTDDLRESPILEVIAALHADGVDVTAHDRAVTAETRIEAQLDYVRHAAPGLRDLAPRLAGMLRATPEAAIAGAEAVIVTHSCDAYRQAVSETGTPVIDVARLFRDRSQQPQSVSGIGW